MDELSPEQLKVLKRATPEQLEFMLAFAGHGVAGRRVMHFIYRLFTVVGVIATCAASVFYILRALHGQQ